MLQVQNFIFAKSKTTSIPKFCFCILLIFVECDLVPRNYTEITTEMNRA